MAVLLALFVFYMANDLGHPDNSIPANPRVTPHGNVLALLLQALSIIMWVIWHQIPI